MRLTSCSTSPAVALNLFWLCAALQYPRLVCGASLFRLLEVSHDINERCYLPRMKDEYICPADTRCSLWIGQISVLFCTVKVRVSPCLYTCLSVKFLAVAENEKVCWLFLKLSLIQLMGRVQLNYKMTSVPNFLRQENYLGQQKIFTTQNLRYTLSHWWVLQQEVKYLLATQRVY